MFILFSTFISQVSEIHRNSFVDVQVRFQEGIGRLGFFEESFSGCTRDVCLQPGPPQARLFENPKWSSANCPSNASSLLITSVQDGMVWDNMLGALSYIVSFIRDLTPISQASCYLVHTVGTSRVLRSCCSTIQQVSGKTLRFFPPRKQNLIIARFEAPKSLVKLRRLLWQCCLRQCFIEGRGTKCVFKVSCLGRIEFEFGFDYSQFWVSYSSTTFLRY